MSDSGWFADPGGKVDTFRWWNGQGWTRWLCTAPTAPDPGAEPRLLQQAPAPLAPSDTISADAPDPAALPPPPDAGDRVVRLPAAAAIVAGALLLIVTAVGAIVSFTADRPLTGPPVAPPPPTQPTAKVAYDPVTRKVSFEEMQFVAPRPPFSCDAKPAEVPGIFSSAFGCSAVVHRNYDKVGSNWATAVSMGHLEDRLQGAGDLGTIANRTFTELLPPNYGMTKFRVEKRKIQWLRGIAPEGRAVLLTAEVHVSKPGLASKYDRAVLAVVKLRSGQHVAWYALQPNDSPKKMNKALRDSADTITAR